MPLYPETIARCQHIKVNGTQCASPALRRRKFCHFHKQYRQKKLQINANIQRERLKITLPMLEDANSIQMGLAQVMRLLVTQQIDRGTAGTLLYALQTASCNLNRTSFEPQPTRGRQAAKTVAAAAAERLSTAHGAPRGLPVVLAGGLMSHDLLRAAATAAVAGELPGSRVVTLTEPPVAGAVRLAALSARQQAGPHAR